MREILTMAMLIRRLVIDASVALCADSDEEHGAEESRVFLMAMANRTSHEIVMAVEIEQEWRQRERAGTSQSFALKWLTWMHRKNRIHNLETTEPSSALQK